MSGLTDDGFERPTLAEIEEGMVVSFEAAAGPINQNDTGAIKRWFGVQAERLSLLWERSEANYLSYYPASAEGASLDDVAELTGLERIAAAKSTAIVQPSMATLPVPVPVPAGTQFSSESGDVFETDFFRSMTIANTVKRQIQVISVLDTTLYRVQIVTTNYDYTSDGTATAQEIVTGIVNAINTGVPASPMTAVDDGTGDSLTVTSDDLETNYTVAMIAEGVLLDSIVHWTSIPVTALVAGEHPVTAGQINTIVTPVAGMDAVEQFTDGIQGRETETDAELRIRIRRARLGFATAEAMRSRITDEVDGVTTVTIIENTTDAAVGGQPAHSIEVIVEGGADQDIADKIWETKPAGIATFGGETETVVDGAGDDQTVYFSRPTPQYAHIRITLTKNTEETYPTDGDAAIAAAVLAYGNTFEIGQDLLWQHFLTPANQTVPGVKSAVVELDVTPNPGDAPGYVVDTDVAIAATEIALFDAARIIIV